MRTSTITMAAVAALGFTAVQASAATILIDDFNTNQYVSDPGVSNNSLLADAAVLGGWRELTVNNSVGGSPNATSLQTFGGDLKFSNDTGATGMASALYNGNGAGLGDLSFGGKNAYIFFEVASFDNDANVNITVEGVDADGTMVSFMENVGGGMFDPRLYYGEFSVVAAGGDGIFDFANVASLKFIVDTTGLSQDIDGALASLSITSVPLPASALLLLGGLGGLGAMRRRKNKATA